MADGVFNGLPRATRTRLNQQATERVLIRRLEKLGQKVTLEPAA
jgi:hypothetical protein